jgi:hypothetical protein
MPAAPVLDVLSTLDVSACVCASRRGVRSFALRRLHAMLRSALVALLHESRCVCLRHVRRLAHARLNSVGSAQRVANGVAEARALLQHAARANAIAELAAAQLSALGAQCVCVHAYTHARTSMI